MSVHRDNNSPPGQSSMVRWRASTSLTDADRLEKIKNTHSEEAVEVDLKYLLELIEKLFPALPDASTGKEREAEGETKTKVNETGSDSAALQKKEQERQKVASDVKLISNEISYLVREDVDEKTFRLFEMLSKYHWDAKLAVALAALALNYAKFTIINDAKLATLKTQAIIKASLHFPSDDLHKMKSVMLDIFRMMVEWRELPSVYVSTETSDMSKAVAKFPNVAHLIIRSIVALSKHVSGQLSKDEIKIHELTDKLKEESKSLRGLLDNCIQHKERKKNFEEYLRILNCFDTANKNNIESIKNLIKAKNDDPPLFDGLKNQSVGINVLKRKHVLLLISSLDISEDELCILKRIFEESNVTSSRLEHLYEVVWIPIADHWDFGEENQFKQLQSNMQWYSVQYPQLIPTAAIKMIREVWHFRNNTVLVALDTQGKVISPYALHFLWFWRSYAFPFTTSTLENLWEDFEWKLDFIVDGLDEMIIEWIKKEKFILLFGGDDAKWAKDFTDTARDGALAANIELKLVCVRSTIKGDMTSDAKEKTETHNWCHRQIWFFWTRLESLPFYMIHVGNNKLGDKGARVMNELGKLFSYRKEGAWAILAKGSEIIVNGPSDEVKSALAKYNKESVPNLPTPADRSSASSSKDRSDTMKNTSDMVHSCCRFTIPMAATRCPERMVCPVCSRLMSKQVILSCCHTGWNKEF